MNIASLLAWTTLAAVSLPFGLAQESAEKAPLTPDELFEAWSGLEESGRVDTSQWFLAECDRSTTFRSRLERYLVQSVDGNPHDWPEADERPTFDPKVHTPGQVIERRFVKVERAPYDKTYGRLKGGFVKRAFVPAVEYDWARGEIVQLMAWDDPERIARNASRGFTPYTDLAEALVERQLDDRSFAVHAKAFGHAYSDRAGKAFREITLYTAWSSGAQLEMPDVEVLGIYHALTDDWKTYVAPVPGSQHRELYKQIAEAFSDYRKFRDLRTALAVTYLQTRPDLPKGYAGLRESLHGMWELHGSDPAKLAEALPSNQNWETWIEATGTKARRDAEVDARRRGREKALADSSAWARRTFEAILREYGAFDPKPEAPAGTPPKDGDDDGEREAGHGVGSGG